MFLLFFLTANDQEVSIVMGPDMGADDYITKPFKVRELLSRIKTVLRRTGKSQEKKYHLITSDVLYLQGKKLKNIEKEVQNIIDENQVEGIYYENVQDTIVKIERMILAIKILLYGYIALVTLIGITSVYNTTVTSLALRRREFAMLRSVGMGPKGFRKMLFLESFFFIAKAFLYALPTSWILILIIHYGITYSFYFESILFPWKETLIAILFAYLFVLITTMYATKKVRKENILEMIREENI